MFLSLLSVGRVRNAGFTSYACRAKSSFTSAVRSSRSCSGFWITHLVREGGCYLLRANNPDRGYPDIPLGPKDRIIGVVRRVVKRPGQPPKESKSR